MNECARRWSTIESYTDNVINGRLARGQLATNLLIAAMLWSVDGFPAIVIPRGDVLNALVADKGIAHLWAELEELNVTMELSESGKIALLLPVDPAMSVKKRTAAWVQKKIDAFSEFPVIHKRLSSMLQHALKPIDDAQTSMDSDATVFLIPIKGQGVYPITESKIKDLSKSHGGVNVACEISKMVNWCKVNPSKRKTRSGMNRFINSWLSRAQNSGAVVKRSFLDIAKENALTYAKGGENE